ncbi:hypothetical protein L3Y34_013268 [Caenorhabditis briggsae]|uniref:Uncharacterized protein n=1 Tax=Caenorhabditis briggsae TaxID=6238 RepID=A0AAE8ZUS4_CAEBR|nr:hypothetical protein L3Y34_013268 [Caenorhabditis briggsae]
MDLSSSSSSHSDNEDLENKEETAQQWIYRHLVEFTNCEDSSAKSLVEGDVAPLIQLVTDMAQTMCLFVTATKPVVLDFSAIAAEPIPLPVPEETKTAKKKMKKKGKLKALKKKKNKTKGSKKALKLKKKEKNVPVIVEPPLPVVDATVDMIFEWWTHLDIPPHEQFMFVIPKSRVPNVEAKFDELYHVGFMKNRKLLKAALSCLDTVFYDKTSFAMKIDLLLLINEIEDRKMSKELVFERKSQYMTNYSPENKVEPICVSFKKVVQKLVLVSREVFETQEDWSATNKVSFSFYIVGILEEEIDSIIEKVQEMNSEARDMSLDRSAMQATKVILTELDAYLQEKCLESAVESGNLESLRSLAATIVKHNKRLERVVALY